jgi:hypothetical protein
VITWRYHLISIVAVVLAFGLGILAGTSIVGDAFATQVQKNYDAAVAERDDARAEVAVYERFAEQLRPTVRDDRLLGEEAVVVTMEGVDAPARRTAEELRAAGVNVLATLELTQRLAQPDVAENAAALQDALAAPDADADALRALVAEELADRLATGPPIGGEDLLERLLAEGLVTADRDLDAEALLGLGGVGQLIVLAAGGQPPAASSGPQAILVPLTEELVRLAAPTSVAAGTEDGYGFVTAVRNASDVPDCAAVTVDDIDLAIGGIALVMGIDRFLDDPDPAVRPGGDYGLEGDALVPDSGEVPDSCRR